jgi:hypothetical protein
MRVHEIAPELELELEFRADEIEEAGPLTPVQARSRAAKVRSAQDAIKDVSAQNAIRLQKAKSKMQRL